MGKVQIITKEQQTLLDLIAQTGYFQKNFYFTGGTALSLFHYQHRESVDLDFFTQKPFEPESILSFLNHWSKDFKYTLNTEWLDPVYKCLLTFSKSYTLKIDFAQYPYQRVDTGLTYKGLSVDGKMDIGINKMFSISQRHQVKDYVDLYYLLEECTFWDLRIGVKVKFGMDFEPMIIASDFLAVEDFTFLPTMIKPLSLDKLKEFYREQAKKLAQDSVEE